MGKGARVGMEDMAILKLNDILPSFASPNLTGPLAVGKSTIVPLWVTRMIPSFTSCAPILRTDGIKSLHALGESARATCKDQEMLQSNVNKYIKSI